jgi:hypothetical protein
MDRKTGEKGNDPLLYASLLDSLLQEGGGWRFFGGDLAHWVVNFRKNRRMTRERIAQLQGQVSRAERLIEEAQIKTTGGRLDKWR